MAYLLLLIVVICASVQNILTKKYDATSIAHNIFLFNAVSALSTLMFFVAVSRFDLNFKLALVPYSIAFAVSYIAATAGIVLAIGHGPLSISSLVQSYSLIIPALYGIIFANESLSGAAYIGIALLLISLFLINGKEKETSVFSFKWVVFIVIAFVGNGMCSVTQKIQQTVFEGEYKSEYMIIALIIVCVFFFAFGLPSGKDIKKELVSALPTASLRGLANGITNLLVMHLTGMLDSSVLFPTVSAGGIVITFAIALTVYKERLSKMQLFGYTFGIMSVILLNI